MSEESSRITLPETILPVTVPGLGQRRCRCPRRGNIQRETMKAHLPRGPQTSCLRDGPGPLKHLGRNSKGTKIPRPSFELRGEKRGASCSWTRKGQKRPSIVHVSVHLQRLILTIQWIGRFPNERVHHDLPHYLRSLCLIDCQARDLAMMSQLDWRPRI